MISIAYPCRSLNPGSGKTAGRAPQTTLLQERDGGRALVFDSLREVVKDHFEKADILARMGYARAAKHLENKLPTNIKTRSGDLCEILATEYVRECTGYDVPINRLRYKDDREMAMRGDDVIGVRRVAGRVQVLKGEAKSRAQLSVTVVKEACDSLTRHASRPNPSSLAFVASRLREEDRDDEADVIETLMEVSIPDRDIEHLVFTLSGNDPAAVLAAHAQAPIRRRLAGMHIFDHQQFIKDVYEAVNGAAP
jgi:hypothetical protein